jgi:OPA family glycerol-3-phosphate transporter-like MFS transporter
MVSAKKPAAPVAAKRTAPAANVPARDAAPKAAPKADKAPASNKPGTRTQPAGRPVTRGAAKKPATRAGPVVKASARVKKAKKKRKSFFEKFLPILLLLIVVTFIIARLPPPDFGGLATDWRTAAFRQRRVLNWLPLGLTYAFLYMGRYNLKISKFAFESIKGSGDSAMMSNQDFGIIFAAGTVVYGMSFLINGPMTDRLGGKFAILVGAAGSCVMNFLMGLASWSIIAKGPMHGFIAENFVVLFSVLYAGNMYFQSFGAVAIVKVNASWFHVRERGVFGAIFGILISLGIYFAFDIGYMILKGAGLIWVFFVPAALLAIFWVIDFMLVRDTPGQAGLQDFDTADASSGDDGPQLGAIEVFKLMLKNPVIVTIALIEFCSGFLRQAIMQWYRTFAKQTDSVLGLKSSFVYENWGMLLCIAGITGGVIAGIISDRVFQSRRGPVAGLLYGVMFIGGIGLIFAYTSPIVGGLVIVLSMAVIGVHGMLSGTASMDFGGRKNVGVAVGIIDGFVYLGTAVMSLTYAFILPKEQIVDGKLVGPALKPENWIGWPVAMVPIALIGFLLALRVWNARPQPKSKPPKAPEAAEAA